jgi:uncharacterized protein (TIGR01319 family)
MPSLAILIDFGSTFTKLTAVDLARSRVVGRSQAPSTVLTDVREGLLGALQELHESCRLFPEPPSNIDGLAAHEVLASSSAAGGLRMVVLGLVPGLTVRAAMQAALGAGAKIVGSLGFKLDDDAIREIEKMRPDMILLTGGTDGGDSATILHNASLLARSDLTVPVVVAGNAAVAGEVFGRLAGGGKEARRAENVMPRSGELSVESAREEIRKLFMERITEAKGLEKIREIVPVVLPTPMAVLEGVRLAAQGCENLEGWGDMLVVDVGGATTDVHSIGYGHPAGENLGIRFNAATIMNRVGLDLLQEEFRVGFPGLSVSGDQIAGYIDAIGRQTETVPQEHWHCAADAILAGAAVDLAVERHVGKRERVFTREGETWIHYGKDMRETRTVIGTGGVFRYNPHVAHILSRTPAANGSFEVLRPKHPQCFVDSSYLLYAVGLLAETHPQVAVRIFADHMKAVADVNKFLTTQ